MPWNCDTLLRLRDDFSHCEWGKGGMLETWHQRCVAIEYPAYFCRTTSIDVDSEGPCLVPLILLFVQNFLRYENYETFANFCFIFPLFSRISRLTQLPDVMINSNSYFQVVRYGEEGHYNAHHDSGDNFNHPCCHTVEHKKCEICR